MMRVKVVYIDKVVHQDIQKERFRPKCEAEETIVQRTRFPLYLQVNKVGMEKLNFFPTVDMVSSSCVLIQA
jgi:hypothetical protein